jgi:ATP-dependent exoDNAse (exonuclease V) beta subunit
MFDDVEGLPPEVAAQWTALVEECRPLLANDGMEAVQTLLAVHGISTVWAIAITHALLGKTSTPLRVAIDAVCTSAARQTSRSTEASEPRRANGSANETR